MTMMCPMTPETYFNENFKGKSKKEQKLEIKKLKTEIKELQKKCKLGMKPSPILSLNITKSYLDYAKKVLSNNIEFNEVKELTLDDVFTIENRNDPSWESQAKKIVEEFTHSLYVMSIYNGVPVFFSEIVGQLKNKNISELEEFFIKRHVVLPESEKTREAILQIIIDKVNKV